MLKPTAAAIAPSTTKTNSRHVMKKPAISLPSDRSDPIPYRPTGNAIGPTAPIVAGCLFLVPTSGARAQGVEGAVYTTIQVSQWTVAPAIVNHSVRGFLAYASPETVVGSNITLVWYQRESDGSWTTWGWNEDIP